jgi:hypothetical protein
MEGPLYRLLMLSRCTNTYGRHRKFLFLIGEKIFRNRPIRNKNCLWRPCLFMDQDEIINHYRKHSIDASGQVSVHLAQRFQRRRFFRNQPIRVITKLPNSEQSYKGKVKIHKYINRQNQSTTGKL